MHKKYVVSIIVLVFVGIVVGLAVAGRFHYLRNSRNGINTAVMLQQLWEQQSYNELVVQAEAVLTEYPFSRSALLYAGFSNFYIANATLEQAASDIYYSQCITHLRTLLLFEDVPQRKLVHYVLGKAYYHRGELFFNEAIKHLEMSVLLGYDDDQIDQYLGSSYSRIGDIDTSIAHYRQAFEKGPTLDIAISLTSLLIESMRIADAENLISEASNRFDADASAELLLLKTTIETIKGNYQAARNNIDSYIAQYNHSPESYYLLGNIYELEGDDVQARYNWRQALLLNKDHKLSYDKLQL